MRTHNDIDFIESVAQGNALYEAWIADGLIDELKAEYISDEPGSEFNIDRVEYHFAADATHFIMIYAYVMTMNSDGTREEDYCCFRCNREIMDIEGLGVFDISMTTNVRLLGSK